MKEEQVKQLMKILTLLYKKIDRIERKINKKPERFFISDETYLNELLSESELNNE